MSIATKTGDAGETSLMYGRRVPKSDPRVDAYGCVDEARRPGEEAALSFSQSQACANLRKTTGEGAYHLQRK